MSKICISNCVSDGRIPVRATYVNLYKWPESDVTFLKSAAMHGESRLHRRVVDSISCRQMYLRSYKFSRKETVSERTMKCLAKVKERLVGGRREKGEVWLCRRKKGWRRPRVVVKRLRDYSHAVVRAIFRKFLFCITTVDVVDRNSNV